MGMDLSQGGHLTHGSPANMSGKNYNFVSYGVSAEDGRIDYDALAKQVAKVRPSCWLPVLPLTRALSILKSWPRSPTVTAQC